MQKKTKRNKKEKTVKVLYQKIYNKWFAFSLFENEVFFGVVDLEDLEIFDVEDTPAHIPEERKKYAAY